MFRVLCAWASLVFLIEVALLWNNLQASESGSTFIARIPKRIPRETLRKAYVFLLTSGNYECMTRTAILSLQESGATSPILLLHMLERPPLIAGVKTMPVNTPRTLGAARYKLVFAKLEIARLNYDRVMFFDSDVLVLKNPEPLFQINPGSSIAAPVAYWLSPKAPSTGGPLIVNPSPHLFADVLDTDMSGLYEGEMDFVIEKYGSRYTQLSNDTAVLISEYIPGEHLRQGVAYHDAGLVHFDGEWKPPMWPMKRVKAQHPNAKVMQIIYKKWWMLAEEACPDEKK